MVEASISKSMFLGVPDAPISCYALNISANEVQLLCMPGFDGGEEVKLCYMKYQKYIMRAKTDR